jgi:hypothetical protein
MTQVSDVTPGPLVLGCNTIKHFYFSGAYTKEIFQMTTAYTAYFKYLNG